MTHSELQTLDPRLVNDQVARDARFRALRAQIGELLAQGHTHKSAAAALGIRVRQVGRAAPSSIVVAELRRKRQAEEAKQQDAASKAARIERLLAEERAERLARDARRRPVQSVCERCGQLGILPCAFCSPD